MTMPWSNQSVSLIVVEAGGGGFVGLFVYSGAPAVGNLIASIAPAAGTDPYGNGYGQGIESQLSGTTVTLNGGVVTFGGGATLNGTSSHEIQISSGSVVGQHPALIQLDPQNIPSAGGLVTSDTIQAWDPSQAFHSTAETWHSLGTLAGYTVNEGRYRLTPEGELELDIDVTPGGANAALTAFSNTLPAAYQPAINRRFPMATTRNVTAGDNWPRVVVDAGTGVVQVQAPLANITNNQSCNQRVPLT